MPGGKSSVDESLFASKGNKKSTQGGPAVPTAGLVISRSELAKIKKMGVIETYAQKLKPHVVYLDGALRVKYSKGSYIGQSRLTQTIRQRLSICCCILAL